MTTYFSDTFAGDAGTLSGHSPGSGFDGLSWVSGTMALNGAGFARPTDNTNRSVHGEATYGDTSTARGLPGTLTLSFTLKTGPSVSGGSVNAGFFIQIYANGITYGFAFGGTDDGWAFYALVNGAAGGFAYPTVAPNTEYSCTAEISPATAGMTIDGVTVSCGVAGANPSIGLSGVYVLVGGTCLMGDLVIGDAAAPSIDAVGVVVAAAGPLGAGAALAFHDFTGQIGSASAFYVMDLVTPTGTVRVPVSSWQATLQTGSSNYVQCVIPACEIWAGAINAATEFVISRRAVLPDDSAIEYEMARAPAESPQFDRGSQRHTCTLSGYSDAFAASEDPPTIYDRALTGIRSISSGSSYRVRCAVDWLLRPGHRAFVEGAPFVVKFINYYAPSGFDSYMDVGG